MIKLDDVLEQIDLVNYGADLDAGKHRELTQSEIEYDNRLLYEILLDGDK